MSKTKERLLQFLKYKNLGQQRFEQSIGMSNGWVNNIGDSIRENSLNKIRASYPELNTTWLISGVGSMLSNGSNSVGDSASDGAVCQAAKLVPILPISCEGGSLNEFVSSVKRNDCELVISPIREADFAIRVTGDSMAPEYPNGSEVFIKRINEKAFIDWGRVYVLDTCNGTVIKILEPSEQDGCVRCISINDSPRYAPFDVSLNDVYGIYRVLLCMCVK